jgi:membrane protein YdbS with pleckstrin-like domain
VLGVCKLGCRSTPGFSDQQEVRNLESMVGAVRFELTTSCTRNTRASQATLRPEPEERKLAVWSRNCKFFPMESAVPSEETTIWEGNPSQVLNLGVFLLCGLFAGGLIGAAILFSLAPPVPFILAGLAVLPVLYALVSWLQIKCVRYQLTSERLRLRTGVLSRKTDEVELYRVKDYVLIEPLSLRLFGLSNISLTTTDDANPQVLLHAVPEGDSLRDQLRKYVEICRQRKGVRITEFEG